MEERTFLRIAKVGLVMLYAVIVAGAIVRMTGSGMGCPDWPKCFGVWVPPTDVSQLPANYQEIYSHRGYADTSFNVYHTWTEYLNRLTGALCGFVLLILLAYAGKLRKKYPYLIASCVAVVIAIGFQGWLGKVVVDSILAPVKITIHMLMALVLVAMLLSIMAYVKAPSLPKIALPKNFKLLMSIALVLTLVQVALGTQVRQQIDHIALAQQYQNRNGWVDMLTNIFKVHRSFSIVVLALNLYLYYLLRKSGIKLNTANWIVGLLVLEIITGVIMAYAGVPAYAQPVHLVLATIIFGLQFAILVNNRKIQTIAVV